MDTHPKSARKLTPQERRAIAFMYLEELIGGWSEFREDALEIVQNYGHVLAIRTWDEIEQLSVSDAHACQYRKSIETLAERLGLRATWGAHETHAIINGAMKSEILLGQRTWEPSGVFVSIGEPEGFEIEVKRKVEYPDEWTDVREAILKSARKQYEDERRKNKWGNTPARRPSKTLLRNVQWLFKRIVLRKSIKQIASEDDETEEQTVRKAVSDTAKLLGISLSM